jgi:hypothetical protein
MSENRKSEKLSRPFLGLNIFKKSTPSNGVIPNLISFMPVFPIFNF